MRVCVNHLQPMETILHCVVIMSFKSPRLYTSPPPHTPTLISSLCVVLFRALAQRATSNKDDKHAQPRPRRYMFKCPLHPPAATHRKQAGAQPRVSFQVRARSRLISNARRTDFNMYFGGAKWLNAVGFDIN